MVFPLERMASPRRNRRWLTSSLEKAAASSSRASFIRSRDCRISSSSATVSTGATLAASWAATPASSTLDATVLACSARRRASSCFCSCFCCDWRALSSCTALSTAARLAARRSMSLLICSGLGSATRALAASRAGRRRT